MPTKISECNINKEEYMSKIELLALKAFDDQCTGANPRYPLVEELHEIYKIYTKKSVSLHSFLITIYNIKFSSITLT